MHNRVTAFILLIFLTACAAPTPAPTPTATTQPSPKPTQSPTLPATPEPSHTTTPEPTPVETPQATPFAYSDVPTIYAAGAETTNEKPRIGTGIIQDIALSPDSTTIAVGTTVGVYLYDVETFKALWSTSILRPVRQIKWSPDGSYIAVLSGNGTVDPASDIFLLDAETGTKWLRQFDLWYPVNSFDWSPGVNVFAVNASASTDIYGSPGRINELVFYEAQHQYMVADKFLEVAGKQARIITYSPDGSLIGYADDRTTVYLVDAQTGAAQHILEHDYGPTSGYSWLSHLSFSPDGKLLATYAYSGKPLPGGEPTVFVWDIQTGTLLHVLDHEEGIVTDVAWSDDSTHLISASYVAIPYDDSLTTHTIIWDITTGEPVHSLDEHPTHDIALSPDGQHLVIAGYDYGSLSLLNTETWQIEIEYLGINKDWDNPTFDPVWLPDQTFLVVANHALVHYGIESDKPLHILQTRPEGNTTLWTQDGLRFAVTDHPDTGSPGTLWDGVSGRFLDLTANNNEEEDWFESPVTYTFNYGYLFQLDQNCYQSVDGELCVTLEEETIFHPEYDKILLTTVQIWDTQSNELLQEFTQADVQIDSFSFSPDGRKLAVGYGHFDMSVSYFDIWNVYENFIAIYYVEGDSPANKLYGHTGRIQDFAWSPDGTKLLSRSADGSIILWNWL